MGIRSASAVTARIGLVSCETAYPPRGGPSVHIYQVWHRLQRMGYEIHAWGRQAVPGSRQYARTADGFAELLKDVDVLYVRFPFEEIPPASIVQLLIHRRMPVVCEFNAPLYEFTRECPPHTFWSMRFKAKLYARNHLPVRTCVDHGICVSSTMARYVRREFGLRKVMVLPNGGDPELFDPALRPQGRAALRVNDGDFVVFWGGWTAMPWQGLDQVFEAARQFHTNHVRFVIAGDPAPLPTPLPHNALVIGELSYFDIPRFMAAADACLCLYKAYDWCRIGFYNSPLKLFDYMASGRPVIGSNMGQIGEVIQDGENGLLTDGAPEDIAEKIEFLRKNPERREAMGRAARETVVRKYNWQNVAERTAGIIEGLLTESRGQPLARKRQTR